MQCCPAESLFMLRSCGFGCYVTPRAQLELTHRTLWAGHSVMTSVTCNNTAPEAEPRPDMPNPAASPDAALRRTASERAAAPCAAFCGRPVPSSAAAAPMAPSAAWTLLFSDSLLLAGAPSALAATPLQAVGAG